MSCRQIPAIAHVRATSPLVRAKEIGSDDIAIFFSSKDLTADCKRYRSAERSKTNHSFAAQRGNRVDAPRAPRRNITREHSDYDERESRTKDQSVFRVDAEQ